MGARIARPKGNLRAWARPLRALGGTCETWAHALAPGERLANRRRNRFAPRRTFVTVDARMARPERSLRT